MSYSDDMRLKALASLAAKASGITNNKERCDFRNEFYRLLKENPGSIESLLAELRRRESAEVVH